MPPDPLFFLLLPTWNDAFLTLWGNKDDSGLGYQLGALFEKKGFFPLEMSNTCKNFQNPKIGQKWLSMVPPPFFTKIFFCQNDSELPKMDFKHNFNFFFEGFP